MKSLTQLTDQTESLRRDRSLDNLPSDKIETDSPWQDHHNSKIRNIALIQDLEDLLDRKVHVATVKGLREYFRDRILNEAVRL